MKKIITITVIIIAFATIFGYLGWANSKAPSQVQEIEQTKPVVHKTLLELVNEVRVEHGAAALAEDPVLDETAGLRAQEMADANYFEHSGPNGEDWARELKPRVADGTYISENIAQCFADNEATVIGWENSKSHFEAMIDPKYTRYGTATVWDNDRRCNVIVNHFAS